MSATTPQQGTGTWSIDPSHSSVDFSVKHMGIFTVRGSLGTVTGTVETVDGAFKSIELDIDATAISTGNADRDNHLKGADFLNTEKNPTITFRSTGIDKNGDFEHTVAGDLTIAGQTHPVTVELEVVPPITDPYGLIRSGATGSGMIKRSEWGLTYNSVMETGHLMIGDDIKFTFDVQGTAAK